MLDDSMRNTTRGLMAAHTASAFDEAPVTPREPYLPPDPIEPEPPPAQSPRDPDPYPRYEDVPPAQPIDAGQQNETVE